MTIVVGTVWQEIGHFPDGSPMKAAGIWDNDKVIGRVVDLSDGNYRADYFNGCGDPESAMLPDYYTAILRIVEEAKNRLRRMN